MRVKQDEFSEGRGVSAAEGARRAQIIDAAIDTIAELGYTKASFARIVERAGLSSTRMISYHFAGKDDLIMATIGVIMDHKDTFLGELLSEATTRQAMLRAYVESEIAYLAEAPRRAVALAEIGASARTTDGTSMYQAIFRDIQVGRLERQLTQGQREGAFGTFDPAVMALAIRQAIDGVALRLAHQPGLDLDTYARELADLFDKATRAA